MVPATHPHAAQAWITRPAQALPPTGRGPLDGLRFAVKDNIDVAGWPTTAACRAYAYTPTAHATVVQKLLDAGASLVGKTNLDQFACGLNGTRSPWGPVPNAFDPEYISGGSSSGSAYVVATGQVDFALGTDTAGSGRVPAGFNNIVGLKPTRGLVSAAGVVPAAQSVDCVSIFAPTVALAARVLSVIAGDDPADPYGRAVPMRAGDWPARWRFGLPAPLSFQGDAQAEAAFDAAVAQMRALGGEPVTVDYRPLEQAASLLYDSALVAERYAAIRTFFDGHEDEVLEPVRSIIASGRHYSAADWCDARRRLLALRRQADRMWSDIDVLMVPTAPTIYTIAQMLRDPVALNRHLGHYTNFVNLLDYAALSVPQAMRADGLPAGVTLIAPAGSDWALATLGQRLHHASGMTLGATGRPLPPPQPIEPPSVPQAAQAPAATVRVAVVGAHLSGMPLNAQLTQRGARLVGSAQTAADYRFFALPGTTPPKPGLVRVAPGRGGRIALELWDMPVDQYGSFVALVPPPLSIGTLLLDDGSRVQGFLCEALAAEGAEDITHFGGWRAYLAAQAQAAAQPA